MRKAFTLVELLVVVAIIGILVTILVPVIRDALIRSRENSCAANLKVIGGSIAGHMRDHDGRFPRVHDTGDPTDALGRGVNLINLVSHNAMDNVWTLIEAGLVPVGGFKCPADDAYVRRTAIAKYGWTAPTEFSYGIHYPTADNGAAPPVVNPADPGSARFNGNSVVMADKNSRRVTTLSQWDNHSRGGAVLRFGGTVEFTHAETSVVDGDDMYGDVAAADGDVIPDAADDVVILPGVVD